MDQIINIHVRLISHRLEIFWRILLFSMNYYDILNNLRQIIYLTNVSIIVYLYKCCDFDSNKLLGNALSQGITFAIIKII